MCMCNIYKKIALPSEFIRTVRLILATAAFKKDSKAVTWIRERWLIRGGSSLTGGSPLIKCDLISFTIKVYYNCNQ